MRKKAQLGLMVLLTALFAVSRHRFLSGLFGMAVFFATVFMAACGGWATSTLLSFEIEVTGASLQPSSGSALSLLTSAAPPERPVSEPGEIQENAERNCFTGKRDSPYPRAQQSRIADGIANVPEGKKEHT